MIQNYTTLSTAQCNTLVGKTTQSIALPLSSLDFRDEMRYHRIWVFRPIYSTRTCY